MKDKLISLKKWPPLASVILVLILCVYGAITVSYFFKPTYLNSIIKNYTPIILVSLGLSVVIIGGGIDLAIGTIASLVNCIVMLLNVEMGLGIWPAMLIGILVGVLCGAINGAIIAFARLNPLISSFAFSWITGGLALWLVPDRNDHPLASEFVQWYGKTVVGIPTPVFIIAFAFIIWLLIYNTNEGPRVYALGKDMKRLYVTGVKVEKTRIVCYMFSGLCAALTGISMTGAMGVGAADIGDTYTIQGIAACVIGGVALTGGVGSAFGGISGGIFIGLLTSMVVSSSIGPYYQGLVTNAIILVSILAPSIIYTIKESRKNNKSIISTVKSVPWLRGRRNE